MRPRGLAWSNATPLLAQLARCPPRAGGCCSWAARPASARPRWCARLQPPHDGPALLGACEHLGRRAPLGPLADVAARTGGRVAAAIDAGSDPRRVALTLLGRLADRALVLLEDVHWADEATLDVLRVLGRRVDATPSLVVATYRDDEVGRRPSAAPPARRARVGAGGRARLGAAALARGRARARVRHGADGDAIHALTRGNPFFVTELLAAGAATLPATVRDAVLARAARLSPGARRLLDGVALVPARAELWLLDAAFPDGRGPRRGVRRPPACCAPTRAAVAFRHELARLAVESSGAAAPPARAARGDPGVRSRARPAT